MSLIVPSNILSGISSHNKSFLDSIIYDKYLVTPMLANRNEIISQLISFSPKKNSHLDLLIKHQQNNFKRKFLPLESINTVAVFPSCSSTDNLRRLNMSDWLIVLKKLSNNKRTKKITLIFPNKNDIQFLAFEKLTKQLDLKKIGLKITIFEQFVDEVKGCNLIVSVDSQAIHIGQFLKREPL